MFVNYFIQSQISYLPLWMLWTFQLQRNILGSQPRVTKFKIDWDDAKDSENIPPSENGEAAAASSQNSVDMKTALAVESSNSACAMEVAWATTLSLINFLRARVNDNLS